MTAAAAPAALTAAAARAAQLLLTQHALSRLPRLTYGFEWCVHCLSEQHEGRLDAPVLITARLYPSSSHLWLHTLLLLLLLLLLLVLALLLAAPFPAFPAYGFQWCYISRLTYGFEWSVLCLSEQHEVAGLDVPVQYAVVVALRQRAQHSTHVAGHLRQQQQQQQQ
jgi:hypothetical protein